MSTNQSTSKPTAIEVLEYALDGLGEQLDRSYFISNGAEIRAKLEEHREVLQKRLAILRTANHGAES